MRQTKWINIFLVFILFLSLVAFVGCTGGKQGESGKADTGQTAGGAQDVQEETYVMKLSHATRADGTRDLCAQVFKEKLEKATNGRIKVELYPNSQLGNNVSVMQGLQMGTIEGQIAPTAYMTGFEDLFAAIDLAYLWPNMDVALDVLNNSQIGTELIDLGNARDIYTAAYWPIGERYIMTTNFAVTKPADLQGHKIRVMDDPLLIEMFKSWGAVGVPMAFDELYNGLQQGIVEGLEVPLSGYYDMKLYEVAKNLTLSEHSLMLDGVFISKPWYDKLPADLQAAVTKAARDSIPETVVINADDAKKVIESIKVEAPQVLFHEVSNEAQNEFAAKVQRVHDIFASRSDAHKKLIDDFKKAIEERK